VNTEERQLAEMLHRVTPEPPRRVTVDDVAYRLASQPGREPRPRRGSIWNSVFRGGRGWTPVLAALSVFAIAGASAGIATVATSHHGRTQAPGGGPATTGSMSGSPSPTSPSQSPTVRPPQRVAGGMWGAELINQGSFMQGSLTGTGDSLFITGSGSLARIDPATGATLRTTPYNQPVTGRPVIVGNTVWVVATYNGGDIVLHGYDTQTLAQVASVSVPAIGEVPGQSAGVLAAAPDGKLYVAAGDTVAIVDPGARAVTDRIYLTGIQTNSVAVSPDGKTLYVGTGSFRLMVYNAVTQRQVSSSRMPGNAGNLIATDGGVWGTTSSGGSGWTVWFAPGGDLARSVRVTQGAGGGSSLPSYSGGVVWVGGTRELVCASPATGHVLASTPIPADHGAVEYFDSPTVLSSGHAYTLYQDQGAQLAGVASLTPPRACSG
jgi:hypothetical protein